MELKRFRIDAYKEGDPISFASAYCDHDIDALKLIEQEKKVTTHRYELIDQSTITEYINAVAIENRIKEYPPIEMYIDGVVKNDQAQIDEYKRLCLEVKAKYPKV